MKNVKSMVTTGLALGCLVLGGASFASGGGHEPQPGDDHGGKQVSQPINSNNDQVRVRIPLKGVILNGELAKGHAEYRADSSRFGLRVEAEDVNLPDGTKTLVTVDGTAVGMIVLRAGHGELEINTRQALVGPGSAVAVVASVNGMAVTVLSGHF